MDYRILMEVESLEQIINSLTKEIETLRAAESLSMIRKAGMSRYPGYIPTQTELKKLADCREKKEAEREQLMCRVRNLLGT